MNGRGPTSHDVAREAGVSQSAVSRAFTPGASISPQMREVIEAAAERLGYRPSRLPGMMRRGKSGIVAVVVGGLYNPFHTITLESFTRALTAAGKQTLLVRIDNDRELDDAVGDLVSLRVDGVLSALSIASAEAASELDRHQLPIVMLNSAVETEWVRCVNSDNEGAGRLAAQLLHASGSRRLASIMGPRSALSHSRRAAGFADALRLLGVEALHSFHGELDYDWGRQVATGMVDMSDRPDGIFCGNDLIAAGLIDCWAKAGLQAPQDFRIIGYDNMPLASWDHYDLTSFDQQTDAMAEMAVGLLEGHASSEISRTIDPALVRRKSC